VGSAKRFLVLTPAAVDGSRLRDEIERRAAGEQVEAHLVAPAAPDSKLKAALGDVDDAVGDADTRLNQALAGLRSDRVAASGVVGDADPLIAAEDALGAFPADEILIVTHPESEAEWFEEDLFDRAAERFEPPVTHVELTADGGGQLQEVEHAEAGIRRDEPDEDEIVVSPNMPPFSVRDLIGIGVALLGTGILALLAAISGNHSNSAEAAVRILIAIAFALINLAHVVGLVLFNSQDYRGFGRPLFAKLSLYGTPAAVVVSLLAGLL
jgi:hypothetical protein